MIIGLFFNVAVRVVSFGDPAEAFI